MRSQGSNTTLFFAERGEVNYLPFRGGPRDSRVFSLLVKKHANFEAALSRQWKDGRKRITFESWKRLPISNLRVRIDALFIPYHRCDGSWQKEGLF